MSVKPTSQCGRVLAVLSDGARHSVPEIHRRAGTMRLNSRVAELRKHGYDIVCEHERGKQGARSYFYTWVDAPAPIGQPDEPAPLFEWDDLAPRDERNRYRIYRVREGQQELVATCASPEAVGVAICTLGAEDEWKNSVVGVLDSLGDNGKKWLLNPYEPSW